MVYAVRHAGSDFVSPNVRFYLVRILIGSGVHKSDYYIYQTYYQKTPFLVQNKTKTNQNHTEKLNLVIFCLLLSQNL